MTPEVKGQNVPYTGGDIVVDKNFAEQNEIALYMMEHYDFTGELKFLGGSIAICGQVEMDWDMFPLVINDMRKDL